MWDILRIAAVIRHRVVWRMFGSNPLTWPLHKAMIEAVYDNIEKRK